VRQDFQLPLEDVQFLTRLGLPWETVVQGSERWVLIHEHPLPNGYNHVVVSVAILISGGYPEAPLDMFFVFPAVVRVDGVGIPAADTQQAIDGRTFHRWSRHRPSAEPWRPGIDNLETHHDLTCDAFRREFLERPRR
jgi:hypothetical protein